MKRKVCDHCGRSYNQSRRTQRFCSVQCRSKDATNRRAIMEGRPAPNPVAKQLSIPANGPLDWDTEMAAQAISGAISHCETKLKHLRNALAAIQGEAS